MNEENDMAYAIPTEYDAAGGIRFVIEDQLEKIEETIADEDDIHEAVHDIRKRFKKIRAAVRLARGALEDDYKPFNVHFRDAGRELSDIRDAQAMLETLDVIHDVYGDVLTDDAFSEIRSALTKRRDQMADEMDLESLVEGMRRAVAQGRDMMDGWAWSAGGFDALIPGFEKSYERAQRRMKASYDKDTVHEFHQWRKRVKYHRYHLKILRKNLPTVLNPMRDLHHELTDLIGEDHDLAVFLEALEQTDIEVSSQTHEALAGLFGERSKTLRASARPLGEMLFGEPASVMSNRMGRIWDFARSEREEIYVY